MICVLRCWGSYFPRVSLNDDEEDGLDSLCCAKKKKKRKSKNSNLPNSGLVKIFGSKIQDFFQTSFQNKTYSFHRFNPIK